MIETLICLFQAEFAPKEDNTSVSAIHAFLETIKPATEGLPVPESYSRYWRQRRERMVGVKEETKTADSTAVITKDLMNATKRTLYARGPGAPQSLIDVESVATVESVHEEPPPAYLPPRLSDSHNKHIEQKAGVGEFTQERLTEDSSQTLRRGNTQRDLKGQNQNSIRKIWQRRLRKWFRLASGS